MAALGLVIILSMCAAILLAFGPYWAVGSLFILMLSLNRFFLPSRFSMDACGITAQFPLRRKHLRWRDVRRFLHDRHGGYLSTRSRASRLDAFSGMHLMFGSQREEVMQRIRTGMTAASQQEPQEASTRAAPAPNGGPA